MPFRFHAAPLRRLTLRARMAILVIAGVLPLLAFNLGSVYATYLEDRERAGRRALEIARGLALAVEGELDARVAALEVLALSRALAAGDMAAFRAEAEAVVARQAKGADILLLREDGQQVMHTAVPPGEPLSARQELENQRRVFATGRPSVSDVFTGAVTQRPVVAIEVPVRREDGSVGLVLAMNPTLDDFSEVLRRERPGPGWAMTVLDRTGTRVARVPNRDGLDGRPAPAEFLRAWSSTAREGMVEMTSPEGAPVLAAFSRVPGIGWGVAVAVPTLEVTGPAWRSALLSVAFGLALLAVGLALAHLIARSIVRPIAALGRVASAPDSAGGPVPVATGLPEADLVAEALLAEARRRRAATASLLESERRLRLVVAELNHRAKNALATVQALALETARGEAGADPARFASEFGARLRALALAHDLLTAFSWEVAALDAVIRAGLAPWLDAGEGVPVDPRIAVDCAHASRSPPVSPGQAQALVMALHELATNAAKHGALSVPEGRVEVACRADGGGPALAIEWRESGGPPVPAPPARRGFGTRLLEQALARDLGPGGSVSLDFDPGGLRATIRFGGRGAARAVEPAGAS